MKLNGTDIACLGAAAQRQDQLIPRPDALSAKARRAAMTRLLQSGAAEEVAVEDDALGWRREAQAQIGLRITAAGLATLDQQEAPREASERERSQRGASRPTKRGTKRENVIALLAREEWARIGELIAATGWLPHTTRAAITGLRRSGYSVETTRDANGTLYRIPTTDHAGEG